MYNAPAIYDMLTEIFPNLKLQDIPSQVFLPHKSPRGGHMSPKTLFQFWDFMDPHTETEGGYEKILWDSLSTPVLVFQNGGIPAITNFKSADSEIVQGKTFRKARCFGETIIGEKYQLFGAVILHGTRPGRDGGSHYTSYFRTKGGQWWYYDDIGPVLQSLPQFPTDLIFREERGSKPEMYFYRRNPGFHKPRLQIDIIERRDRKNLVLVTDRTKLPNVRTKIKALQPTKTRLKNSWLWVLPPSKTRDLREKLNQISLKS